MGETQEMPCPQWLNARKKLSTFLGKFDSGDPGTAAIEIPGTHLRQGIALLELINQSAGSPITGADQNTLQSIFVRIRRSIDHGHALGQELGLVVTDAARIDLLMQSKLTINY